MVTVSPVPFAPAFHFVRKPGISRYHKMAALSIQYVSPHWKTATRVYEGGNTMAAA